jgi:hypothetical protein
MWRVSTGLMEMLNALPKKSELVFPGSLNSIKGTFFDNPQVPHRNTAKPKTSAHSGLNTSFKKIT